MLNWEKLFSKMMVSTLKIKTLFAVTESYESARAGKRLRGPYLSLILKLVVKSVSFDHS